MAGIQEVVHQIAEIILEKLKL